MPEVLACGTSVALWFCVRNNTLVSSMTFRISLSGPVALAYFAACLVLATITGCIGEIGGPESQATIASETGCTPPPPPERTVAAGKLLFVVGDTNLNEGDQAVSARFAELGFTVTLRRAVDTQVADTTGRDLVVISSTVTSTDLGTRLRDVAVPVVTWESSLFDDLRLTGVSDGSDFGATDGQESIDIVGASHPIAQAAHLAAGSLDVFNGRADFRWGKPGSAAQIIARLAGSSTRATVFAYDTGAALVGGGNAARRRVGLYYSDDSARRFNDAGWQLFDAVMLWTCGLPTQGAPAGDVLFVVGNTNLGQADASLRTRLEGLGLTVALRDGRVAQAADTTSRKLVLISESVDSSSLATRLRDVAVPVITFEESLFDDMRLTGGNEGNDWGNVNDQTKINVVAPTHPIAVDAGLGAGLATVVGSNDTFHFGKPAAGAQIVATLAGSSQRATVFTYATGAALAGGQAAPARRVAAFFNERTAAKLNANGLRLFDAMVRWAMGVAPPPPPGEALFVVDNGALCAADAALRDRLVALGLHVTVRAGNAVQASDATGKRIVVISGTVQSTDVGTRLRDVAVPVFTWEHALFDEMRFTGAVDGTDQGALDNQTRINVVSPSHAIAMDAGLSAGLVKVVSTPDRFRFGKPAAAAQIVATLEGQPARAALFTFESGAALQGGQAAPARRVGAFFGDDFGTRLNAQGGKIFDACVRWAMAAPGTVCVPAVETCNGHDDDCDGQIDEGVTTTFFRDADGDGFGTPATSTSTCSAPAGFVAASGDCDDTNAARHPGATEVCNASDDDCDGLVDDGVATSTFFRDNDGDSFGNNALPLTACVAPAGYVLTGGDCNDGNAAVHPGAPEVCNLADDNCSGQIDEGVRITFFRDADADGFGASAPTLQACARPAGYAPVNGDCDDANAARHPGAAETCNHSDDNCNGAADEGLMTRTFFRDVDGDGYGVTGSTVVDCAQPAGYATQGGDCEDTRATRNPGAPERCNGLDDNCNPQIDENPVDGQTWYQDADTDGFGRPSGSVVACSAPTTGGVDWVNVDGDCNDVLDTIHPGADEACNGVDDNCNGTVDSDTVWYQDIDADGYGKDGVILAHGCPGPAQPPSVANRAGDCNDNNDNQHPGADEVCNSEDDDCDGFTDENAVDAQQFYMDADHDGFGDTTRPVDACTQPAGTVLNDDDCDDTRADVNPSRSEVPGNHRDDNCNGVIDE